MYTTERAIVFGDVHFPFDDGKAVSLMMRFMRSFKPHVIFINGDLLDCWEISKFVKPTSIEERLCDELHQAERFLRKLRKENPTAKIIYVGGNHEFRFEKFIAMNARELSGLKGMTLEEQLCLKELKIQSVNNHLKENYFRYGKLLIGHFSRVNKHSAYTAKNLLEEKGVPLIQNHTHRGGMSYKRDYENTKVAVENFCLCDLNPPYMLIPNWQLGFSTIHTDTKTGFFKITPIEIVNYHVFFGSEVFKIRNATFK